MLTITFVIFGIAAIAMFGETSDSPYVVGTAYCPNGMATTIIVPVNCAETCPAEAYSE